MLAIVTSLYEFFFFLIECEIRSYSPKAFSPKDLDYPNFCVFSYLVIPLTFDSAYPALGFLPHPPGYIPNPKIPYCPAHNALHCLPAKLVLFALFPVHLSRYIYGLL